MKMRKLIIFLLGILLLGNGLSFAGPSNKPSIPTRLLPAVTPPSPTIAIPPPPLEVKKDCRWVEQPLVYNEYTSVSHGSAPFGMIAGYGKCAIPVVMPSNFYHSNNISTTAGWQWICKTEKEKDNE